MSSQHDEIKRIVQQAQEHLWRVEARLQEEPLNLVATRTWLTTVSFEIQDALEILTRMSLNVEGKNP